MDWLSWFVMKEITAQERKPLAILCLLAAMRSSVNITTQVLSLSACLSEVLGTRCITSIEIKFV
jgi:hypothetical protein